MWFFENKIYISTFKSDEGDGLRCNLWVFVSVPKDAFGLKFQVKKKKDTNKQLGFQMVWKVCMEKEGGIGKKSFPVTASEKGEEFHQDS